MAKRYDQNIELMVDTALLLQLGVKGSDAQGLSMCLSSLNFLHGFSQSQRVPIQRITRELIASTILGRQVSSGHVKRARRYVERLLTFHDEKTVAVKLSKELRRQGLLTARPSRTRAKTPRAARRER